MKLKMEVDLTPEEALELFAGNVENLQQAILNMFNAQMQQAVHKDSDVMEFWRTMTKKSQEMFETYSQAGQSSASDKKKT